MFLSLGKPVLETAFISKMLPLLLTTLCKSDSAHECLALLFSVYKSMLSGYFRLSVPVHCVIVCLVPLFVCTVLPYWIIPWFQIPPPLNYFVVNCSNKISYHNQFNYPNNTLIHFIPMSVDPTILYPGIYLRKTVLFYCLNVHFALTICILHYCLLNPLTAILPVVLFVSHCHHFALSLPCCLVEKRTTLLRSK